MKTEWQFHEVTIYKGHESSGRRELEEMGRHGWQIGGVTRSMPHGDNITFYIQRKADVDG
jgi:hypothetical protein